MDELIKELSRKLSGNVRRDKRTLEKYSHDTSLFEIVPQAVVYPRNAHDIERLVKFVDEHKPKHPELSLTARSAGSCMSGGAINDSLIVDVTKHLNKMGQVHGNRVRVEPGMFYRHFEKQTLKWGKLMPSYPASRDLAAVGGIVANNAGGELSLRYGKTEKYVKSLKVVLADGKEYEVKPLTKTELDAKMRHKSFEGELYKRVFDLVDGHYDAIKAAKPPVSKNSTGYNIWNVWDRDTGIFDLTQLLVGSQGTLGIITDIEFELVDAQPNSGMLIAYLPSLEGLAQIVNVTLKHQPTCIEAFDDKTVKFVFKFFLKFRDMLGTKEFIRLCFSLIPDGLILLRRGIPKMVFLAEFQGASRADNEAALQALKQDLEQFPGLTIELAHDRKAQARFWLMRRKSFALLRKNVGSKHTAPFIDDLVVQPQYLEEFLPKLQAIIDKYELVETIAGHLGDGNFHIIPLMELQDPKERAKIEPCLKEVIKLIKSFNGSMSGEHNDGLIRGPFLEEMYGATISGYFKQVKRIFDPQNIFNPHKKTTATWGYSKAHIREKF